MVLYILVTGSRNFDNYDLIEKALCEHPVENIILVHGGSKGADLMADFIWKKRGGETIALPAEWSKHGRAAGLIRNEQMIRDYKISNALAFRKGDVSKGTDHMISLLRKGNIPVKVHCIE
jgi:hypothetical protein